MSQLLRQYRKAQSDLRDLYDPFTDEYCPTCPTPCCMKPARVDAVDIALAEAHGCALPPHEDPETIRNEVAKEYLGGEQPIYFQHDVPCDFLGEGGCAFPRDLRPYGCTRFICDPMKRYMEPATLKQVKHLLKRFDYLHEQIVAAAKGKSRGRR
jgi:hypothetical protein